jgi:sigma-B regulation protein RsbU (phosphoserine phosphatase)
MPKEKILIVDDELVSCKVIEQPLRKYYDTITASNGEEGLALALQHNPDLIISDVVMPKMDGFELRDQLSQHLNLDLVPFIFLTAMDSHEAKNQGLSRGADDFLTKPVDPDILLKRVHHLLKRSRVYREESVHQFSEQVSHALLQSPPQIPGYDISFYSRPAQIGGGDIISYYQHDPMTVTFSLGDVMGKGTNAKFFAYSYLGYLRGLLYHTIAVHQRPRPAQLLNQLSGYLDMDPVLQDVLISLFILHFQFEEDRFIYSNAGYFPAFYYDKAGERLVELHCGGGLPGLGQIDYQEAVVETRPGDCIILMSDGVQDAKNSEDRMIGDDTVKVWLQELADFDAEAMTQSLLRRIDSFTGNALQYDDISIAVIKKR